MTDLVPIPDAVPARRDDTVLPGTADRIRDGIPANTTRSYERVWRQFTEWCTANGRASLPASAATMADYTAHLCDQERAPSTIGHDMAAIAKRHRLAGHPKGVPDMEAANLVLRGHRTSRAKAGRIQKEAPPITRDRLRLMSAAQDRDTLLGRRNRLMLVIGWALAGRRSELAGIQIEDITVADDGLDIRIRTSKTDHHSEGVTVFVPGGEHVDTDPVTLLREWLALLSFHADATAGPLFRSITRGGKLYRQGSGVRVDGVAYRYNGITGHAINTAIQQCARTAQLPDAGNYSAHSLRAGFATQAATDGIPQGIWARHGRWNPLSPIPAKYVRRADGKRDNPLRRMGL